MSSLTSAQSLSREPRQALSVILLVALCATLMSAAQATAYEPRGGFTVASSGDGAPNNQFGAQVALEDDLAVVASAATPFQPGKLHTFERVNGTWTQRREQQIEVVGDDASTSLSLRDGFLIVGSNTTTTGSVRIYRREPTQWVREYSITFGAARAQSVAIDGYIAVYGRSSTDGSARALRRDNSTATWSATTLNPSVVQAGAGFGTSVAIVAGAVAVGAPAEDVTTTTGTLRTDGGAAYVYELTGDTWNQAARLVEPDADMSNNNQFGAAVAISGNDPSTPDRLLVSSIRRSAGSGLSGRVRGYTRVAGVWTPQTVTLSSEPAGTQDGFGCALRLDGTWAAVGACESSVVGNARGAVSVLRFNSSFTSVVSNTQRVDTLADDAYSLGRSMAIDRDGPTLLLGNAQAEVYGNEDEGVVLVGRGISGNTITTPARLLDVGQGLTNALAGIVSYDGEAVAMSAFGESIGSQIGRGAVYVHRRDSEGYYPLEARLLAPDGAAGDSFGRALALQGDSLIIAAPERAVQGINAVGAVYAFRRIGAVWQFEAQIFPGSPVAQTQFGRGLTFDGNTAIICGLGGTTWVYTRAGNGSWSLTQDIAHGCETPQLQGDRLILNDPFADFGNILDIGEVSTYVRSGGLWQVQSTLVGSQPDQRFGYEIGSDADLLVVTSTGPPGAQAPAQLYRSTGSNWIPETTLQPNDAGQFCYITALNVGRVFLGCPASVAGNKAVYVFDRSTGVWAQAQKLNFPSQPEASFGGSIEAHADGTLFISALNYDQDFNGQGAAFLYVEPPLLRDGFE